MSNSQHLQTLRMRSFNTMRRMQSYQPYSVPLEALWAVARWCNAQSVRQLYGRLLKQINKCDTILYNQTPQYFSCAAIVHYTIDNYVYWSICSNLFNILQNQYAAPLIVCKYSRYKIYKEAFVVSLSFFSWSRSMVSLPLL